MLMRQTGLRRSCAAAREIGAIKKPPQQIIPENIDFEPKA
jgi:hypothetical protein